MKHILFTLVFSFILNMGIAQKSELGIHLGVVNYYGDLNPRQFIFDEPSFAYGLFYRNNISVQSAIKINALISSIAITDANYPERRARGFSFTTNFIEASALFEWFFFGKKQRDEEGNLQKNNSPYLFLGVGALYSDPLTEGLPENSPDLTAEQSTINAVFPFGIGYRWEIDFKTRLGIEYGFRPTFSDYLDGISESANPDKNDWYNHINIQLSYLFRKH